MLCSSNLNRRATLAASPSWSHAWRPKYSGSRSLASLGLTCWSWSRHSSRGDPCRTAAVSTQAQARKRGPSSHPDLRGCPFALCAPFSSKWRNQLWLATLWKFRGLAPWCECPSVCLGLASFLPRHDFCLVLRLSCRHSTMLSSAITNKLIPGHFFHFRTPSLSNIPSRVWHSLHKAMKARHPSESSSLGGSTAKLDGTSLSSMLWSGLVALASGWCLECGCGRAQSLSKSDHAYKSRNSRGVSPGLRDRQLAKNASQLGFKVFHAVFKGSGNSLNRLWSGDSSSISRRVDLCRGFQDLNLQYFPQSPNCFALHSCSTLFSPGHHHYDSSSDHALVWFSLSFGFSWSLLVLLPHSLLLLPLRLRLATRLHLAHRAPPVASTHPPLLQAFHVHLLLLAPLESLPSIPAHLPSFLVVGLLGASTHLHPARWALQLAQIRPLLHLLPSASSLATPCDYLTPMISSHHGSNCILQVEAGDVCFSFARQLLWLLILI